MVRNDCTYVEDDFGIILVHVSEDEVIALDTNWSVAQALLEV